MNVAEALLSAGEDYSSAVLAGDTVMTYQDLRFGVTKFVAGLLKQGYAKGERIGIFSENSPFFVLAYLATIRAGLVAVPFQVELAPQAVDRIASNAGIRALFVSERFRRRLLPWSERRGIPLLTESACENCTPQTAPSLPELDPRRDLAALMFTSGSTGEPKGVMISHRNIECNSRDIISYIGLSRLDRAMVVLPFHYCFGLSLLHTHLMVGGSVVLNNEFRLYPETVLKEMQQKECTGLAGVPSTYQLLLGNSRFRTMSFPSLRWFQQAGGKLPNTCIKKIVDSFPQARFFLMYGQTEGTARLSYLPPERLVDKLGSIGKGLPSTKLEVVRPDGTPVARGIRCRSVSSGERNPGVPAASTFGRGNGAEFDAYELGYERPAAGPQVVEAHSLKDRIEAENGEGEAGEIVASGDNVALGYWNEPQETASVFKSGALHTGDIARVDSDGFIFIVERARDMIKSGGNRVSSKKVEEVIAGFPEVIEVAVVGMPHELLGESIKAFLVISSGAMISPEEVRRRCHEQLPSHEVPHEVIFLHAMPHSGAGKILKAQLRLMLRERDSFSPEI